MTLKAPEVGDRAPAFLLPDSTGKSLGLTDFVGRRVILYFYPAAMTPGCTTEACDFNAARADLDTAGYTVLGVSPDAPSRLATFSSESGLQITLLSDTDKTVMQAYGAYGEKQNYGRTVVGVIRSTFIIGPTGVIEKAWRNVKATGHVGRILAEIGLPV